MLKNNIVKSLLFVFISVLSLQVSGQMKQKVADRLYNELAFFKAVELYKDLAKRKKGTTYQIRRTAECYRKLNDPVSAEMWYDKVVKREDVVADDYYYYAQALKSNEKYLEAKEQLKKYGELKSRNSIAKDHIEANDNYIEKLKAKSDRYEISNAGKNVNTKDADFSPTTLKEKDSYTLMFVSDRRNKSAFNKKSQWTGGHFTDVYGTPLSKDWEVSEKGKSTAKDVRSKYHEGPVAFSNNGSVMYLTRSNYLGKKKILSKEKHNNMQILIAKKEGDKWGELKPFKHNSNEYSTAHAAVTEDGKTMYFCSDMQTPRGGNGNKSRGGKDIWRCVKKDNGEWGLPENLVDINTEGDEMWPSISESGILYFASNGHLGLGGLDLYRAEPNGDGFSFVNMGYPLNTSSDDFGLVANADEEIGFFSSNRVQADALGNDDIYRVNILYPFGCAIKGLAVDMKTGEPIPNAEVKIIEDESGNVTNSTKADENGFFFIRKQTTNVCKVIVEKESYEPVTMYTFKKDDKCNIDKDTVKVPLKKYECGLIGVITDAEDDKTLSGVQVTVINNLTKEKFVRMTDGSGQFYDSLINVDCPGGEIDYTLKVCNKGYLPKTIDFKYTITKPGVINVNEMLKGGKIDIQKEKGDVKKFCKIEEILFNFNKYNIRSDAAVELDKLVACMKDYPVLRIRISAHTDCEGKNKYNLRLSNKRAKSCRDYVKKQGISSKRISGKGFGEEDPRVDCKCYKTCTEEDNAKNRRIQFDIVGLDEAAKKKISADPDFQCNN